MTQFYTTKRLFKTAAIAASLFLGTLANAQAGKTESPAAQRQKMVEIHKKMGEMHTKMAACLESDKDLTACRKEMTDTCSADFGGTCKMMGKGQMGGRGKGMGMMDGPFMNWMMNPESDAPGATATTPKK